MDVDVIFGFRELVYFKNLIGACEEIYLGAVYVREEGLE